jgi:hypothetical protein
MADLDLDALEDLMKVNYIPIQYHYNISLIHLINLLIQQEEKAKSRKEDGRDDSRHRSKKSRSRSRSNKKK